jgi:hemoglobin
VLSHIKLIQNRMSMVEIDVAAPQTTGARGPVVRERPLTGPVATNKIYPRYTLSTSLGMPSPDLCSEAEVAELVRAFYARVRDDAVLGPVFERHVADWDVHLPKMVDFWSAALRGSRNYRGTPMPVHCALPGLTHAMFGHWLDLFLETARTLPNRAMAERAVGLSQRIAQSLWYGYQLHRDPDRIPDGLPRRDASPTPARAVESP